MKQIWLRECCYFLLGKQAKSRLKDYSENSIISMFVGFYLKLFEASHYILFLTRWRHLPLNEETGLRCDRIW